MIRTARVVVWIAGLSVLLLFSVAELPGQTRSASPAAGRNVTWHTVEFAIVRFNENAPNSWNIYHSEKKGMFLVRLWKRYLLVNVNDQEVYDIDPQKIKVNGDAAEWSLDDVPEQPIDSPDFTSRNVGTMERIRFRIGKDGHFLELQIPLGPNGRPLY